MNLPYSIRVYNVVIETIKVIHYNLLKLLSLNQASPGLKHTL